MLPTPSTSHVSFDTIYEPAEDSYLLLDTLSSSAEAAWLSQRFNGVVATAPSVLLSTRSPSPIVVEVGTGSGVVLAFVAANAQTIFGRQDILTLGTDVNSDACIATCQTVRLALEEARNSRNQKIESTKAAAWSNDTGPPPLLAAITADLCAPLRSGIVDVLIFNPPYVPTPELPDIPSPRLEVQFPSLSSSKFERDSYLLSLSFAGGKNGMETTNRLLHSIPDILHPERGVAYILLCVQNRPDDVKVRIRDWGPGWAVETVGRSGVKAGWERLVIIRIWREIAPVAQHKIRIL